MNKISNIICFLVKDAFQCNSKSVKFWLQPNTVIIARDIDNPKKRLNFFHIFELNLTIVLNNAIWVVSYHQG